MTPIKDGGRGLGARAKVVSFVWIPAPSFVAYCFKYIQAQIHSHELVWRNMTSKLVECSSVPCFELASNDTSASNSGGSGLLRGKKGILVLLLRVGVSALSSIMYSNYYMKSAMMKLTASWPKAGLKKLTEVAVFRIGNLMSWTQCRSVLLRPLPTHVRNDKTMKQCWWTTRFLR